MSTQNNKGIKLVQDTYEIEVKYSPEAIEKKLVKFVVKGDNKEIVLSADELISVLVNQVNSEVLSATFVETERVNVVEVVRQLQCALDRDYKKGEVININYTHPYPIEFALIEEVWKIAKIRGDAPVTVLTDKLIEDVRVQIKPQQVDFLRKFYKSFKNINTEKNMEETKNEVATAGDTPVEAVATANEVVSEEAVVETPAEAASEEVASPEVAPEASSDEPVAEASTEAPAEAE